jgi:hypothetical protein
VLLLSLYRAECVCLASLPVQGLNVYLMPVYPGGADCVNCCQQMCYAASSPLQGAECCPLLVRLGRAECE